MKKVLLTVGALGLCLWLALTDFGAKAQQSVFVPATMASTPVGGAVAGVAGLVSGITGKQIYVTSISLIPVATSKVTFVTGTGANCTTGMATPTGAMTFAAGQTLTQGVGNGTILVVPSGVDLCIYIATAAAPGFLTFSQF